MFAIYFFFDVGMDGGGGGGGGRKRIFTHVLIFRCKTLCLAGGNNAAPQLNSIVKKQEVDTEHHTDVYV